MAEKKTIELDVQSNLGSLRSQLREAQAEVASMAAKFGETSEQARNAAKRAAELKDRIGDAKNLTDSFNPEAKFAALGQSINAASGAFTAMEGVLGLVGIESENLQKQLLKVQSAMAITQGLEALGGLGDAFKNVKSVAVDAFKGIKQAIGSSGIGLLVIALGTVVVYWDDIKKAVSGVSSEQRKLNAQISKNAEIERGKLTTLNNQDNVLKLQGKSEKEILNLKIGQYKSVIATSEAEIKSKELTASLEYKAAKRNADITKGVIRGAMEFGAVGLRLLAAPIDMVLKVANKVSETLGFGKITAINLNDEINKLVKWGSESATKWLFDPEETKAQSQKDIQESKNALTVMKNDLAGFQLQVKQIDQKSATDSKKSTEDKEEEKKRIIEEYNKKLEEFYDSKEKQRQEKITDAKEKELQAIDNKYEELYAKADAANQSDKELIIAHQEEIAVIEEKYRLLALEKMKVAEAEALKLKLAAQAEFQAKIDELDELNFQNSIKKGMTQEEYELELVRQKYFTLETLAEGNAEQLAIIEQAKADEVAAIQKKQDDKEKENAKKKHDYTVASVKDSLQMISDITTLFAGKSKKEQEKAFKIQKAVNIATAIVDTYKAANAALASAPPPFNFIAMGAAITAGLVNVKKISDTKFEGGATPSTGGGGGTSGAGAGSIMSPSFNVVGNSGLNQLAQLQQQPMKAYVVSGDVTSAQSLDRNRIENATFLGVFTIFTKASSSASCFG